MPLPQLLDPRRVLFQRESCAPMIAELEEMATLRRLVDGREVVLVNGRLAVPVGFGAAPSGQVAAAT